MGVAADVMGAVAVVLVRIVERGNMNGAPVDGAMGSIGIAGKVTAGRAREGGGGVGATAIDGIARRLHPHRCLIQVEGLTEVHQTRTTPSVTTRSKREICWADGTHPV